MPVHLAEDVSHGRAPRAVKASRLGLLLTLLASLSHPACAPRVVSSQSAPAPETAAAPHATPTPTPEAKEVLTADSLPVREDELTHEGYTARRLHKTIKDADMPGGEGEVAYVVLERGGRVVRSFDAGVYHGGLNAANFGLFPLLGGGGARQLVVSQDAPREGRQWVVSLSPSPRVIFDGGAFGVGRESGDLRVEDLDRDGVYEIIALVCDFYGFHDGALATAETPLPLAIFRYDAKAGKYLPANRLFREHLLKGVDEARAKVRGPSERAHLGDVLSILLSYVFAGDEREGWEFYEAAYALPDRAEVRREVEATLRAQPVYRSMYRQAAGR